MMLENKHIGEILEFRLRSLLSVVPLSTSIVVVVVIQPLAKR